MKSHKMERLLSPLLGFVLAGCVGTTGSGQVDFDAYASGPADAEGAPFAEHSYTFLNPYSRYTITLTKATLQIGAVYLDANPCNDSSAVVACVDASAATVAEVNGGKVGAYGAVSAGLLLDTLSSDPQPFATSGSGIIQEALSAEVWLVTPDGMMDAIDDPDNSATIANVAGSASKDGHTYPFTATITIGENRLIAASNPAMPGENPICEERIVRPICLTPPLEPEPNMTFRMQVDPKAWFNNVDFALLGEAGGAIPDNNDDVNGNNLFQGLEQGSGVYSFVFEATP